MGWPSVSDDADKRRDEAVSPGAQPPRPDRDALTARDAGTDCWTPPGGMKVCRLCGALVPPAFLAAHFRESHPRGG